MLEKDELEIRLRHIEDQNRILKKSKESQIKKHSLAKQKMEKQISRLNKDNSLKEKQVMEREKEIQG